MSIHNYITLHRNSKIIFYRSFGKRSRVSQGTRYLELNIMFRKSRVRPIKQNVGYTMTDSQYRFGNA